MRTNHRCGDGRCTIEPLEGRVLLSGAALVADLEPAAGRASAAGGVTLNGIAYFAADSTRGRELFRSDGTKEGTYLLRDVLPGALSSEPLWLAKFKGQVYFTAGNRRGGRDLWATDGTRAGTKRIAGFGSGTVQRLLATRRALFFTQREADGDLIIEKSDGTTTGTSVVTRSVGGADAAGTPIAYARGRLFFITRSGGDERPELWTWSDAHGGSRVREFATAEEDVDPHDFNVMGGSLYFLAHEAGERQPWRSDGTPEGTRPIVMPWNGGGIYDLSVLDKRRLRLRNFSYSFISDGTAAGTHDLSGLQRGPCCTRLAFDGDGKPRSRWRGDPVVEDAFILMEPDNARVRKFRQAHYYLHNDNENGASLWRTDGTRRGTVKIKAFRSLEAGAFVGVAGGRLLFSVRERSYLQQSPDVLWMSDGTTEGTQRSMSLYGGSVGSDPQGVTAIGQDVYFARTFQRVDGFGTPYPLFTLYRRDAKTGKIAKVFTTVGTLREIVHADGKIYVRSSQEPWCCIPNNIIERVRVIDTGKGTVKRFYIGSSRVPQHRLMPHDNGSVLLPSGDENTGVELSILNASGELKVVKDINPDGGSFPAGFVRLGDTVLFAAADGGSGRELWRTDGTAAGTRRVRDVSPGAASSDPADITAVGDVAFFVASDGVHGRALWKSDGSEAGTVLVKDLRDDLEDPHIASLTVIGDRLYFVADDGVHGPELWTSDGSREGTQLVKDVRPGSQGAAPANLTILGDLLYFSADDGVHGQELWRSDGTLEGTTLVSDLMPGRRGSSPRSLFATSGRIFFAADDPRYGVELWETDGTLSGTRRLTDLFPGRASSDPTSIVDADGQLFFTADDGRHGRELWQLPL